MKICHLFRVTFLGLALLSLLGGCALYDGLSGDSAAHEWTSRDVSELRLAAHDLCMQLDERRQMPVNVVMKTGEQFDESYLEEMPEIQLSWSTTDKSVIDIDSQGVVEAMSTGTAEITVAIESEGLSDTVEMTVKSNTGECPDI